MDPIEKVLSFIIEIDAGDTIIYASETQAIKDKEAAGLKRLLAILPQDQAEEYLALWYEFELGESAEAAYAKAIDRLPPLLHNLHGDGHSWRDNHITKEQIFSVNSRIAKGSEALWSTLELQLETAFTDGILAP